MPTPTVYTKRDGTKTYRVRTRDALNRQTTETFTTKREAETFAKLVDAIGGPKALATRSREDKASDDYMPSLAEMLTRHIDGLTGVEERTRLDYTAMARRTWLPTLGPMPIDLIERTDVARWQNAAEKDISRKSIANARALLSAVMKEAVRAELITIDPCEGLRLPKQAVVEEADEIRFLTRAEYHALMDAMPAQHRPLTALLFGAGLRWSEATALRPGDISAGPPHTARVRRAWKRTPGKGMHLGPPKSVKSRRAAVLSVEAYDLIKPLLDRPPASLIFTAPRGGKLHHGDWRERVWVPACRAAGLASPPAKGVRYDGPGIHDARHTHASWLLSTGQVTLEMLQDQLGHESILTTRKVYAALIPETRNRLAEALRSLATDPPVPLLDGPDHV